MERNINIKIDIDDRAPTSYNDLIKVGDSINLTIDLLSKGESVDLKDSSVELFLKKEDGTKVEQEVIIGDSKVSCTPLNIQSTAAVGQVCGELVVESSGKQVTSSTFIFNVEGSTSSEILEESKDDIATIKSLQNTIVNVNSVVEKYKTNIEAIAGTSESIEALAQIKIYAESAVTEIETVVNTGNTLKTSLESENTRAENNIQELNNLGSESIKTHINNTDIHVDASDKTKWDSYEQLISDNTSHLNDIRNSGYFDISKDAKGAHYKTIKENGFYRNVTGTPTTGTGGVLLVISNTDKWSVAYKWLSISNTVITEYNACKDGDNYEEWKEISTNDTGWLNLPLSSGVVVDSGLTPQYRKIGNRVFIRGSVKNILNGNSVIGTLPVGFRPVLQNHHYATFTNTNACASFNISTDGRIIYQGNSTNTFNAEWFVVITNNFII